MTYKILTGDSTSELEDKVSEHLDKGFQMVGGVVSHGDKLVQAVVKL